MITAKERSIDSLRDTLATTKRTYDTRLAQAESALSLKEAEVGGGGGGGGERGDSLKVAQMGCCVADVVA